MDVVVAEVTGGEPLTPEAALQARAADQVTGVVTVTLRTDAEHRIVEQSTVSQLVITDAKGGVEHTTTTQTVTRRRL